eukprot:1953478-Alexandrium_andersonii.AAC.1
MPDMDQMQFLYRQAEKGQQDLASFPRAAGGGEMVSPGTSEISALLGLRNSPPAKGRRPRGYPLGKVDPRK